MGQFKGSRFKVRCVDCTKLLRTRCVPKDVVVSPRKKRLCGAYEFKGWYENSTPMDAMYLPYVDKKTLKMLRRLTKLGILPVSGDGTVETRDGFYRDKMVSMPTSTAVDSSGEVWAKEDPIIYKPSDQEFAETKLIWSPGDEHESEDNRSR